MTPLVATAKFHGKDRGWGSGGHPICVYGCPRKLSAVLAPTLEMVEKENWLHALSEDRLAAQSPPSLWSAFARTECPFIGERY